MTDPNPSYAALRSLVAINQAAVVRALRELGYTVTEPPAAKLPAPTTLTWEHDTDEQGRTCERTTDRRARILCEVVNGEHGTGAEPGPPPAHGATAAPSGALHRRSAGVVHSG